MSMQRLLRAREAFADRHPRSRVQFEAAREVLPGGHTRTVLTHPPFPLTFVSGAESTLTDADGIRYLDLLGDYTAGLLGHSPRPVLDAVATALATLSSVGGVHPHEVSLARLMCTRFGLQRVRFTNSGTEANLMAITTALLFTGRRTIMVFEGGYHGGVLSFAHGSAPWNVPYDFVIAPYNDLAGTTRLISQHGADLAAVIIEPMQGSGGCIPSAPGFLADVFAAARAVGSVCIADEVMTSRHGPNGMVALLGADADITTFGKYIGGGFSFGAFGGRAELLDQFDTSSTPTVARPDVTGRSAIGHAGTFNNNVASMAAGAVVLGEVYTAPVAAAHTARGEEFRGNLAAVVARHRVPLSVTGYGSMMSLHALATAPTTAEHMSARDEVLQELIFLGLYERGIYTAARGMITISLTLTDDQLATALDALDDCLGELVAGE